MWIVLLAWIANGQPYAYANGFEMFETKDACIEYIHKHALSLVVDHNFTITDAWHNGTSYYVEVKTSTGSKETFICDKQ